MCFGGGGRSSDPNLKPAPYALDQSQTAVERSVGPAPPNGQQPLDPADNGMHANVPPPQAAQGLNTTNLRM